MICIFIHVFILIAVENMSTFHIHVGNFFFQFMKVQMYRKTLNFLVSLFIWCLTSSDFGNYNYHEIVNLYHTVLNYI